MKNPIIYHHFQTYHPSRPSASASSRNISHAPFRKRIPPTSQNTLAYNKKKKHRISVFQEGEKNRSRREESPLSTLFAIAIQGEPPIHPWTSESDIVRRLAGAISTLSRSYGDWSTNAVNLRLPRGVHIRVHGPRSLTRELFEVTVGKGTDLLPVYYTTTTTTRFNEARNTVSRRILNCGRWRAGARLSCYVIEQGRRGGYIVNPTMFHSRRLLS